MFSQLTRYASELDIQIDNAEMDIRMHYDTRGKLLLDDVSPSAQRVEYLFEVDSPAPTEKIQELPAMIEKGCHTINTLREPVHVVAALKHNGVDVPL